MNKKFLTILFACLALLLAAVVYGKARAQQPTPSADEVNRIAHQLYCPVCENIPLDTCPTEACARWRDQIRTMLIAGKNEQEIKDYFVSMYGDRVLAAPPVAGKGLTLNWLMYIVPPLAILAGAYVVFRAFKAWQKPAHTTPVTEPTAPDEDEYVRRLEEELKKR